jgi:hypothetical protein
LRQVWEATSCTASASTPPRDACTRASRLRGSCRGPDRATSSTTRRGISCSCSTNSARPSTCSGSGPPTGPCSRSRRSRLSRRASRVRLGPRISTSPPDGRFLYASERTSSTLQAFRVDAERGILAPCGSTPTETQPRGFAIDPSGGVLVAAGETSHRVTSYMIDPGTGRLTPVMQREVGLSPNWVEILDRRS